MTGAVTEAGCRTRRGRHERRAASRRPNAPEYIRYRCGRRLPDSMREWVRHDLAGKGATARLRVHNLDPDLVDETRPPAYGQN